MTGDKGDFIARMKRVLPRRWFNDVAPVTDAVLGGLSTAWSAVYLLIRTVSAQTRLATATASFVDSVSRDFFGDGLPRRSNESDDAFRVRISLELLRPRGTRRALASALTDLTGQLVTIFEPTRPADTGGYNVGGVGYGSGGGWGNLALPYQSFVKTRAPEGQGIAFLAGYGTGGVVVYGNISEVATQVSTADIYASAASILPAGYVAWLQVVD